MCRGRTHKDSQRNKNALVYGAKSMCKRSPPAVTMSAQVALCNGWRLRGQAPAEQSAVHCEMHVQVARCAKTGAGGSM